MLHSRGVIELVADLFTGSKAPLVVDPVMVASSGDPLLEPEAVRAYQERLFPLAALVTPNLDEASALLGRPIGNVLEMEAAGLELARRYGAAFLMKGGHLGGDEAIRSAVFADGRTVDFRAPFTRGVSTHGTGCTYSAAITAGLASGLELEGAAVQAKRYVTAAVADFLRWGGTDALNHFSR